MHKPVFVVGAYAVATTLYVLFHFKFINTNKLVESNNTLAYVASFSMFFLIPAVGLMHLSILTMNRDALRNTVTGALVVGLLGPLLLHFLISRSDDGESAMGYVLIPVAYLAFAVITFAALLVYQWIVVRSSQ